MRELTTVRSVVLALVFVAVCVVSSSWLINTLYRPDAPLSAEELARQSSLVPEEREPMDPRIKALEAGMGETYSADRVNETPAVVSEYPSQAPPQQTFSPTSMPHRQQEEAAPPAQTPPRSGGTGGATGNGDSGYAALPPPPPPPPPPPGA